MARYTATILSTLPAADAFAYMADFSHARLWDPSVSAAAREGDGPIDVGTAFALVARFAGREVPLTYTIVKYEPPSLVVLEAQRGFVSRDTITVAEAAGGGSTVHYDAVIELRGIGRLLDPLVQLAFKRTGAKAEAGLRAALNPG